VSPDDAFDVVIDIFSGRGSVEKPWTAGRANPRKPVSSVTVCALEDV
jgi:hypothetical protein